MQKHTFWGAIGDIERYRDTAKTMTRLATETFRPNRAVLFKSVADEMLLMEDEIMVEIAGIGADVRGFRRIIAIRTYNTISHDHPWYRSRECIERKRQQFDGLFKSVKRSFNRNNSTLMSSRP